MLVFLALLPGCGDGSLTGSERKRADGAFAAIREFCGTAGGAVFVHGELSPEEDRLLHAERRGVEALIEIYRDNPDADYDPPGAAKGAPMRDLLDTLSRQLRFCDIRATDAIERAIR